MNNITKLRPSFLLVFLLLSFGSLMAQTQRKFTRTMPVDQDVVLQLDTRHTKLVFETWNKNELEIEGILHTKGLSEEEIAAAMEAWNVRIKGTRKSMMISSEGGRGWGGMPIAQIDSLGAMTAQMLEPMMNTLLGPMMQSFAENPLPPEFMEGVGGIRFDHEAYKKEGEKYLERWEKEMESRFGKNFEEAMEEWGKNFEKNSEIWSAQMEVEMEAWGEKFEEDMEQWGEQFGKQMEAWGEQFGKNMEQMAENHEQDENGKISRSFEMISVRNSNQVDKTLIIRIPKKARLSMNVRYGEIRLPDNTHNLQATLSHSKLIGKTISGERTNIKASYSPVQIKNWEYGILNANYVKNCSIENAKSLKLNSISSNVKIGELEETGIIAGTFANLELKKLSSGFRTLDLTLENSELKLNLPESPLRFNYTGARSNIEYPNSIKADPIRNYDSEMINGYQKSGKGSSVVNITARFSDIVVE